MSDDKPVEAMTADEVEEYDKPEAPALILSDKQYDFIKALALVILPALGTLYFALAQIWGLPKAEAVVGTVVAVDTFLGLLLNRSAKSYNQSDVKYDGTVVVADDLEEYDGKTQVIMKVKRAPRSEMPDDLPLSERSLDENL